MTSIESPAGILRQQELDGVALDEVWLMKNGLRAAGIGKLPLLEGVPRNAVFSGVVPELDQALPAGVCAPVSSIECEKGGNLELGFAPFAGVDGDGPPPSLMGVNGVFTGAGNGEAQRVRCKPSGIGEVCDSVPAGVEHNELGPVFRAGAFGVTTIGLALAGVMVGEMQRAVVGKGNAIIVLEEAFVGVGHVSIGG